METMKTVIENVKDVAPAEATQTAVEVATKKSNIKVGKTGGIIAGVVTLVVGVGYGIYRATKTKKAVKAAEPVCEAEAYEAEAHEDNEADED